jgi:Cu-Zn family superoxide dismutase
MRYLFLVVAVLFIMPATVRADGIAVAELHDSDGQLVGLASFTEGHDGVRVAVNVFNMPPGVHALHIHAAASCERPDFKSAMGHFNPYGRKHGLKSPNGPHAGDLLNIVIAPDGTGTAVATAPLVTLGEGKNSLFGKGGTALMIHQGPDDYLSDPSGAAGPRIACGVIRPLK